ncbi:hypothetical protein ES703_121394 [subsurface metagenome]|jgi:hypothetical protein
MLEILIIVAIVIGAGVLLLLWLDMADIAVDLIASLAQLVVAVVALTVSLLVLVFNALRRLVKKQHNAILP